MKSVLRFSPMIVTFLGLLQGACGSSPQLASDSELNIRQGSRVGAHELFWKSTVATFTSLPNAKVGRCTGTLIRKDLVLTAAHCRPKVGTIVKFYNGFAIDHGQSIDVVEVTIPSFSDAGNFENLSKDFMDLAILRLARPAAPQYLPVSFFPAQNFNNEAVLAVGTGQHDQIEITGIPGLPSPITNPNDEMRYRNGNIVSGSADGGYLFVGDALTNGGDSGGPLYVERHGALQLVGVLFGRDTREGSAFKMVSKYSSVSFHEPWIRQEINRMFPPTNPNFKDFEGDNANGWWATGNAGVDINKGFAYRGSNNGWVNARSGWNALNTSFPSTFRHECRVSVYIRASENVENGYVSIRNAATDELIEERSFKGRSGAYAYERIEFPFEGIKGSLRFYVGFWGNEKDAWVQIDDAVVNCKRPVVDRLNL